MANRSKSQLSSTKMELGCSQDDRSGTNLLLSFRRTAILRTPVILLI